MIHSFRVGSHRGTRTVLPDLGASMRVRGSSLTETLCRGTASAAAASGRPRTPTRIIPVKTVFSHHCRDFRQGVTDAAPRTDLARGRRPQPGRALGDPPARRGPPEPAATPRPFAKRALSRQPSRPSRGRLRAGRLLQLPTPRGCLPEVPSLRRLRLGGGLERRSADSYGARCHRTSGFSRSLFIRLEPPRAGLRRGSLRPVVGVRWHEGPTRTGGSHPMPGSDPTAPSATGWHSGPGASSGHRVRPGSSRRWTRRRRVARRDESLRGMASPAGCCHLHRGWCRTDHAGSLDPSMAGIPT